MTVTRVARPVILNWQTWAILVIVLGLVLGIALLSLIA